MGASTIAADRGSKTISQATGASPSTKTVSSAATTRWMCRSCGTTSLPGSIFTSPRARRGIAWRFNGSSLRTQGPIRRGVSFSALEQKPFFTFEARGDGSLRSQGRLAESSCEVTTASTHGSIQSHATALPGEGVLSPSRRATALPVPSIDRRHRKLRRLVRSNRYQL
jgi:hypothetical protein